MLFPTMQPLTTKQLYTLCYRLYRQKEAIDLKRNPDMFWRYQALKAHWEQVKREQPNMAYKVMSSYFKRHWTFTCQQFKTQAINRLIRRGRFRQAVRFMS